MVQAGKESYYIVSQFDLFEYKQEAPFFARLSGSFEACIYGLNMVRGELDRRKAISPSLLLDPGFMYAIISCSIALQQKRDQEREP